MGGGEAAREAAGMRWWLVGPIRVLSAGVDGQGVQVVGEDRPARPEMNVLVGASLARVWAVGPGTKPPSRATSRGRRPRRSSSAAVWASRRFSAGLPAAVA